MKAVEFGTLFQFIRNGKNVKQDKSGDGLPITRIETISDAVVDATRVGFAGLTDVECRDWLLEPGDILFSHINSVEHIGKCAVYRGTPQKLIHGMNLLCLRPDRGKLLPEFAKYLMRGVEFRSRLSNFINKAVNQASVSIGNLKTIPVTVPPLAEQRRIAEVLDRAEALRAKRRAALAQLDSLTQSIFLELFGDPATNPKGWPMKTLDELGTEFRYGSSNKSANEGKPALRIPNVARGTIDLTDLKLVPVDDVEFQRLRLRDGDLLFVRTNGNPDFVGRCAVFNTSVAAASRFDGGEFIFASYLIRARLTRVSITPLFLCEYLSSKQGRRQLRSRSKTSAGQFNINTKSLSAIRVPLPPILQQREFARRVSAVERLKEMQRASMAEMDALFASLQHRAFRGEL